MSRTIFITLKLYAWIFFAGAILFVFSPDFTLEIVNRSAFWLPYSHPIDSGQNTLWLALSGTMMAMVSFLSFSLSEDPNQPAAWMALLLSKGTSSLLFLWLAAGQKNSGYLLGSCLDGVIFIHLLRLWNNDARNNPPDLLAPRFSNRNPRFHEVWFAKFTDPMTRNALWIHYGLDRFHPGEAVRTSAWVVLHDVLEGKIYKERWDEPTKEACFPTLGGYFRHGTKILSADSIRGQGPNMDWEFQWRRKDTPVFYFVPPLLRPLLPSGYCTPISLGQFTGSVDLRYKNKHYEFRDAAGSIGHIWGKKGTDNWRWVHSIFYDDAKEPVAVLEILTSRVSIGLGPALQLTTANLWFENQHRKSDTLWRSLKNTTRAKDDLWKFKVDFGDLIGEGSCRFGLNIDLVAAVSESREIICTHSEKGTLSMTLTSKIDGRSIVLDAKDDAAIEWTRPA